MFNSNDFIFDTEEEFTKSLTYLGMNPDLITKQFISSSNSYNLMNLMKHKARDTCRSRHTKGIQSSSNDPKAYFITINPDPKHQDAHKLVTTNNLFFTKYCTKYMFNIEQRGTDKYSMGKGVHSHIVCIPKSSNNFKRLIINNYKHLVGNTKAINIKTIPQDWYQDKTDYIKGIKWDGDKQSKIDYDIQWRQSINLQNYISN